MTDLTQDERDTIGLDVLEPQGSRLWLRLRASLEEAHIRNPDGSRERPSIAQVERLAGVPPRWLQRFTARPSPTERRQFQEPHAEAVARLLGVDLGWLRDGADPGSNTRMPLAAAIARHAAREAAVIHIAIEFAWMAQSGALRQFEIEPLPWADDESQERPAMADPWTRWQRPRRFWAALSSQMGPRAYNAERFHPLLAATPIRWGTQIAIVLDGQAAFMAAWTTANGSAPTAPVLVVPREDLLAAIRQSAEDRRFERYDRPGGLWTFPDTPGARLPRTRKQSRRRRPERL